MGMRPAVTVYLSTFPPTVIWCLVTTGFSSAPGVTGGAGFTESVAFACAESTPGTSSIIAARRVKLGMGRVVWVPGLGQSSPILEHGASHPPAGFDSGPPNIRHHRRCDGGAQRTRPRVR